MVRTAVVVGVAGAVIAGWIVTPVVDLARHGTRDERTVRAWRDDGRPRLRPTGASRVSPGRPRSFGRVSVRGVANGGRPAREKQTRAGDEPGHTHPGGTLMAKHEAPQDGTPRSVGIIRPIALSAEAYLRSRAATTTAVIAAPTPPGRHSRA